MNLQTMIEETIETIEREIQDTETLVYQIFKDLYAAEDSQELVELKEQGSDKTEQFTTFERGKVGV